MEEEEENNVEGIAIIGMAGRFPKAANVGELWEHIKKGHECISHFGEDEMAFPPDYSSVDENALFVGAKGVLEDVDLFDAKFWGYTPKEAAVMDPQQRIFLECAWEAIEDAGYDTDRYFGAIGCYAGCYMDTYLLHNLCSDPKFLENLVKSIQVGSLQTEHGNDKDYIATRAAFKMNLKGPAINVQTACSTSLVAVCMACQNLLSYQSDMCLAGGVTITLPQKKGYFYTPEGMLSKDGHCRTFDAEATGTVFSNAGAAILLKRESDAIADGDHIYAIIKGSALNNDGGEKQSYTAPSVQGQAEVILMAQTIAGINPRTIGLIEAHGTATPLGDPIEVAGLTQAFREQTEDRQFCALGSLKANLGHLDVASGVTGVIKTALALKEKVLPPLIHFKEPNPKINFAQTPFYINTELKEWTEQDWPRRAGVSGFGVGGTNAHVVMEEPPETEKPDEEFGYPVILLSARSESALAQSAKNMALFLQSDKQRLTDIAFTSQVGRKVFAHRACFVASNRAAMITKLDCFEAKGTDYFHNQEQDTELVFMFPGQGAQHPGMARDLYKCFPVFQESFDQCCNILMERTNLDLRDAIFKCDDPEHFKQTTIAQPAIFSLEYSLAQLWMHWGLKPHAMIGHSVGEYCAACLAGVFSLEDALLLVAKRGSFMQEMAPGSMLSVRATADEVIAVVGEDVCLAAINGPSLCVLAGPDEAIVVAKEKLERKNIPAKPLHTSHAFHSFMMEDAVAPTLEIARQISLKPAHIPVLSTVTGNWLTQEEAVDPAYWGRNLRDTVKFAPGIEALLAEDYHLFLEVGPGQTLTTLAKQVAKAIDQKEVRCIASSPHPQTNDSEGETIANAVGRLWLNGVTIDWTTYHQHPQYRASMPTYPFERKRHWIEPMEQDTNVTQNSSIPKAETPQAGDTKLEKLIQSQLKVIQQQLKILK